MPWADDWAINRLVELENANATTYTEFWDSIPSGTTSGTLSPRTGHEFVANQWEDGVDAVVCGITGGTADRMPVYEADEVTLVTATFNTSTGAYVLSGEPAGTDPVALVTAQVAVGTEATAESIGALINSADEKATPVAADKMALSDSADSNILKWLSFTTLANTVKSLLGLREVLSATRTYYVRTDGSDSNTGLANTAGGAFLTIQKAFDAVGGIDTSIYDVTIQLGDGTYTGNLTLGCWAGSGDLTLQGNSSTPDSTVITSTTGTTLTNLASGCKFNIKNFKITSTTSGAISCQEGTSTEELGGINWGTIAGGGYHISCVNGAVYRCNSIAKTISAGGAGHMRVAIGRLVYVSGTTTISGTPAFSVGFVNITESGSSLASSAVTFSGSATGPRYIATLNGTINTSGSGANYFPGDSAGSTATGGQYV